MIVQEANGLRDLPFRDKEAWITLLAMAVACGGYFTMVAVTEYGTGNGLHFFLWFAVATAARLAIQFGGSTLLAVRARVDARAPADGRDRRIDPRATAAAHGTLLAAMIVAGVIMPLTASGWEVANTGLFGIVIAETVRYAMVVAGYRRGWHG